MTTAPHIQKVLDRVDREIAACVREAFAHHMFNAVEECVRPGGWSRGVTLSRNEIPDTSHEAVIAAIRKMLAHNRLLKRARPGQEMTRAREWWLCGALIAEGRLRRATNAVAQRFAPRAA